MSSTDIGMPWLRKPLAALTDTLAAGRLPHALMVEGPDGVGKAQLVRRLSAILLCTHETLVRRPCAQCRACRLLAVGNHPDYHALEPEEGKLVIGVDQVRNLISELVLTGQISATRVGVVAPAHAMTRAAANSLLKTLEEPPSGTTLILVTSRPAALPATVRSRCQRVNIGNPRAEAALNWLSAQDAGVEWPPLLDLAGGAPLKALDLVESGHGGLDADLTKDLCGILLGQADPVEVAGRWEKIGAALCLDWLYQQLLHLASARSLGRQSLGSLQKAGKNIDLDCVFGYADEVLRARAILDTAANKRLLLEGLLIPWMRGLASDSKSTQARQA